MLIQRTFRCCILLLALISSLPANSAETGAPIRRVLIINEVSIAWPGITLIDQGIRSALDTLPYKVDVYREYMDTIYFPDPADQERFREFYVRKYQDHRPDAIITVGPSPLKFMVETHDRAFPGVPVIFCLPNWAPGTRVEAEFAGVENYVSPVETLEAAFHLYPAAKHVVVVAGTSVVDLTYLRALKGKLGPSESKYGVSYLPSLSMPEVVERLKHLPSDTIVLYTSFSLDAAGSRFTSAEAAALVAAASNVPVFALASVDLGNGMVGGKITSVQEQGKLAGELAVRAMDGEKPQKLPRIQAPTVFTFDWRALKRWGMKESNLPPDSIILNRQATPWEQYRWYFILGAILIALQAALISGLLWQRARRRKTEKAYVDLSGRLIAAHEEERSRIAREVHDDYQQRLALVANDLDVLRGSPQKPPTDQQLRQLWNEVSELASDMHSFSHRLHSSTLETLGLQVGIKAFCEEFAQQQGMKIGFTSQNIPRSIPPDIALCLFRVVQEALRNVKRHSGADGAEVMLQYTGAKFHLRVTDHGRGFDRTSTSADAGIGIRSMEERLRLVGGKLDFSSQPLQGTTVEAWVPLRIAAQVAG